MALACETLTMQISGIQSPSDLLSVALATAGEGSEYFTQCQHEMKLCANQPSAAVFETLAVSERERSQTLRRWADAEGVIGVEGLPPLDWQDPNVRDTYGAAAVDPIRSTPYRVFAMYAHRADSSFRFYSYVAAYSTDAGVREYAEILAEEELERGSQARKQRRAAWHAEKTQFPGRPELHPDAVDTLADLLCVSSSLERCVTTRLDDLKVQHPALKPVAIACTEALGDIQTLTGAAGPCSEMAAAEAQSIEEFSTAAGQADSDAPTMLLYLYRDLDRCFVYYDALVNCAEDEAIMLQAQQFSFSAMARIDLLHEAVLE